jgi:hypothetical protein
MRHIVGDMLVLDFEESKNDESRQFPLDAIPEMHDDRPAKATRKLEIESGRVIPWLFHNNERPIVDLLVCVAQGLRRCRPERASSTTSAEPQPATWSPLPWTRS